MKKYRKCPALKLELSNPAHPAGPGGERAEAAAWAEDSTAAAGPVHHHEGGAAGGHAAHADSAKRQGAGDWTDAEIWALHWMLANK